MRISLGKRMLWLLLALLMLAPAIPAAPALAEEAGKRILLVQDDLPWDSNANIEVLDAMGVEYDCVATADFVTVDLTLYAVVIFANDQKFAAYENYKSFQEYLELFAELGGVIVFGACDEGWANGTMTGNLPGDIEKIGKYTYNNYIAAPEHPIVTGALTDYLTLLNDDLYSKYCSHTYFVEETLPAGSTVILRDSDTHAPTLVEYPLGYGRVIASGLTWEHNYLYAEENQYGEYARKALDDLYTYAIRVSRIDVQDLSRLREWWIDANAHSVFVATDGEESMPLENATVSIAGDTLTTDENGAVELLPDDYEGKQTVVASAEGYRSAAFRYSIAPRTSRFFFLTPKTDDRPYAMMAMEEDSEYDLLHQSLHYTEGDRQICNISVMADWGGHGEGSYTLIQKGIKGLYTALKTTNTTGTFKLAPGMSFNPKQPVYLLLTAADGTTSDLIELGIVIRKKPETGVNSGGSLEEQDSFVFADPQKGEVNDSKATEILPNEFQLQISALPIQVRRVPDEKAGTYSLQALIGTDMKQLFDDQNLMENLKSYFVEDFEKAVESADRSNRLLGLMQAYDKQLGVGSFTVAKGADSEYKVFGYYEETYDLDGNLISRGGGILFEIEWSYKHTTQFWAGPIPLYLDLKGFLGTDGEIGVDYSSEAGWALDGKLTLKFGITVSGGLGVSGVASVGAGGTAQLSIQLAPQSKGTLTFQAHVEAYLLFVVDYKYKFDPKELPLWPKSADQLANVVIQRMDFGDEDSFEIIDDSYRYGTGLWQGYAADPDTIYSLQESVLPSSLPQLAQYGDRVVAVFQATADGRSAGDSTVLMYSVLEDGFWSEPQPVCESPTADLTAQLCEADGELYVIWQKVSEPVGAETGSELLQASFAASEICVAAWDDEQSRFDEPVWLTDDRQLDMLPTFASDGSQLYAVWLSCPENDVFAAGRSAQILYAVFDGRTWSQPMLFCEPGVNQYVQELAARIDGGRLSVAYTALDMQTGVGSAYAGTKDSVQQIGVDAAALRCDNGVYYWVGENRFRSLAPDGEAVDIGLSVPGAYQILSGKQGAELLFISGDTIFVSHERRGEWTQPAALVSIPEQTVMAFSASVSEDGDAFQVMLTVRDEDGTVDIRYIETAGGSDVELRYAYETGYEDGDGAYVLSVANAGSRPAEGLTLFLGMPDGSVVEEFVDIEIPVGETVLVEREIHLGELDAPHAMSVEVVAEKDISQGNDSAEVIFALPDLAVEAESFRTASGYVVAVTARNLSSIPTDATISVVADNLSDGLVLDMKNIGILNQNEDFVYLYALGRDSIDFSEGAKCYYVTLDGYYGDSNPLDNVRRLVFYPPDVFEPSEEPAQEFTIVNVEAIALPVASIRLNLTDQTTYALAAAFQPENATYPFIEWFSDDEGIATVGEDGLVTAVGSGHTKITAVSLDGRHTASVQIFVGGGEPHLTVDRLILWVSIAAAAVLAAGATAALIVSARRTRKK